MSNLSLESIVEPHVKKILAATGDGTLDITTAHSHLTLSPKKIYSSHLSIALLLCCKLQMISGV